MTIGASRAFLIAAGILILAYIWRTFFLTAPFEIFATALVGLFTAYIGKRLLQKQAKYQAPAENGNGNGEGGGE